MNNQRQTEQFNRTPSAPTNGGGSNGTQTSSSERLSRTARAYKVRRGKVVGVCVCKMCAQACVQRYALRPSPRHRRPTDARLNRACFAVNANAFIHRSHTGQRNVRHCSMTRFKLKVDHRAANRLRRFWNYRHTGWHAEYHTGPGWGGAWRKCVVGHVGAVFSLRQKTWKRCNKR